MDAGQTEARKARARAWFEHLRDDICAAFEAIEDDLPYGAPLVDRAAGRFVRTPWQRTDHTGAQPISGLPEIGSFSSAHVGYSRHAMRTHIPEAGSYGFPLTRERQQ
jgi:coproporphyrinogen III oxidase